MLTLRNFANGVLVIGYCNVCCRFRSRVPHRVAEKHPEYCNGASFARQQDILTPHGLTPHGRTPHGLSPHGLTPLGLTPLGLFTSVSLRVAGLWVAGI